MTFTRTLAQGAALLAFASAAAVAQAADWHPLKVRAGADGAPKLVDYVPLAKASKDWSICVSFPHMKDPFFLAANYGIVEEAKRLGVRVQTLDAGGYAGLNTQISQIENCVAGGANAVIMVAIARDGMNNLLTQLKAKGVPVVDAINGVSSKDTAVRVLTSPRDEGLRAGQYLAKKHPKGSKAVKIAWLPGPAGAGFVEAFNAGFQEGVKDSAAVPLLKARKLDGKVKLVSVYMTPGVYQGLKSKNIEAAGSAPVVLTARIMLDSAVRVLEKKVEHADIGTLGQVYTQADIGTLQADTVLAPASFKPVFKLGK